MSYVYFVQPESGGPIKIGLAKNPQQRLTDLQISHYERLILLCVIEGDRATEQAYHRKFAYCRRLGEWFDPSPDLLALVAAQPQLNFKSQRIHELERNPCWKGTDAALMTKRQRVQRRYPVGPCEKCGNAGQDRRFRDGNPDNLTPENVMFLCRRCAMEMDGRLEKFVEQARRPKPQTPPRPCSNCGMLYKPLRKGRCHNCSAYFGRKGVERPVARV